MPQKDIKHDTDWGRSKHTSPEIVKGESTAVTWRTYEPLPEGLEPQVWAGAQDSACSISSVPTPTAK